MERLKPIGTKADYEATMAEIERGAKSGTPEGDRLEILATLVDAYESQHYPMDPLDPIEAIRFRIQQGLTRKDLAVLRGTRTRVAEVLNRRRGQRLRASPATGTGHLTTAGDASRCASALPVRFLW